MACKEQGVTTLGVGLVVHAAATLVSTPTHKSVLVTVARELLPGGVAAALLVWLRVRVISPQTPSFTPADNPAAHAPNLTTRALSIGRYWSLHARLLVWPATLSFDWSQGAVPLVSRLTDPANLETAALLVSLATLAGVCEGQCLHLVVVLALALLVIPFLPSSNLPAYVGFVVAERVLYIPSMGFCLLVALGSQALWRVLPHTPTPPSPSPDSERRGSSRNHNRRRGRRWWWWWWCGGRGCVLAGWVWVVVFYSARTLRRNVDWQTDEALYLSGVAVNPPKALSNLGVVYSEQGRLVEAEWAYRHALTRAPYMADTHFNLGLLLVRMGRAGEAEGSYRAALRCRPWLAQAHLGLAAALQHLGRDEEAIKVFEACLGTDSSAARDGWRQAWAVTTCRQHLAKAHVLAGRPHTALHELHHALLMAPEGYGVHALHTLAAEAHLDAGEHGEAQAALTRALAVHPHHAPAHITFSRMLQANGSRVEEVEQWLRQAVALAPNDPHVHKHLGQLLLEQDRIEEAVGVWLRAALLGASDHTTAFNAATALRLAGRTHHAEAFYRKAVHLQPNDVASQRNLGAILHVNGKLQEAKKHYDLALTLAPGDPQTTTNLQRLSALINKE
ncbi:hypothetical protein Pmani_006377 [Petrolisthes manimaculis]|uniref:dolichyl-phosphate-mannose--protein mannosyltransferase n=1 Tax=Petrolisthes manimaculis TaxID=1843537 RepID=A0AAE1QBV6_9EUCA|nr:hypothetical protein Pmani_006377 [Petrolisthes manimaculis]